MFLAAKLYCGRKENLEGRDAQMDVRRRELRRGSERTAALRRRFLRRFYLHLFLRQIFTTMNGYLQSEPVFETKVSIFYSLESILFSRAVMGLSPYSPLSLVDATYILIYALGFCRRSPSNYNLSRFTLPP